MNISERKFKLDKDGMLGMDPQMRNSILDEIRLVLDEGKLSDTQISQMLKYRMQQRFKGGKWQIMIGKEMHIHSDQPYLKGLFLKVTTEQKTIIIFKKCSEEAQLESDRKKQ